MAVPWSTVSLPAGMHPFWSCIWLGGTKFVAIGPGGKVITSADDGHTWTSRTAASSNDWSGLAYDGTTIVAVAYAGASTRCMTSTDDGHTWTGQTIPEANTWAAVCSPSAGTFVAVASTGVHQVMVSTNSGATWTAKAHVGAGWMGVATDGSTICAWDGGSDTMTSTDGGNTWTLHAGALATIATFLNNTVGNQVIRYSTGLGQFVACGYNGSLQGEVDGSSDGITWSSLGVITSHIGFGSFEVMDEFGGFAGSCPFTASFGAASPKIIGWTDDEGATWTADDTTFSGAWSAAAWNPTTGTLVQFAYAADTALLGAFPVPSVVSVSPLLGSIAGSTFVTITGTGFTGFASTVTFGGTPALSVNVINDTTITLLTPPHAEGLVDVTVTGIGTLSNAFSFVRVTRVSPKAGTVAGGTPVTITGFGFNAAAADVLFDTDAATAVVIVSNTSITAVTPSHASGAVDVTVSGVAMGTGLYTYTLPIPQDLGKGPLLPPIPTRTRA